MKYQQGGAVTPRTWLVIALIAVALASAATNIYLLRHRQLVINYQERAAVVRPPSTTVGNKRPPDAGIFPDYADVCDGFFAICWEKT